MGGLMNRWLDGQMMVGWMDGQMDRHVHKLYVSILVLLLQSYEACIIIVHLRFFSPKLSLISSEEWIF